MRKLLFICAAALVVTPAAAAHVTLNPDAAPAESFTRFAIRVPTERDNPTVSVTVQLPVGLTFVSFQPKPGWRRTVKMAKLEPPIEVFGERITERVAEVTWTGGSIGPGEFDEFGMSARMPSTAGRELVFPSIQTYSNGEVVRWIGPPDADEPAPRVKVEAAAPEEEPTAAETETEPADEEEADEADDRANLALGFGIAGLVAGLGALALSFFRRRP